VGRVSGAAHPTGAGADSEGRFCDTSGGEVRHVEEHGPGRVELAHVTCGLETVNHMSDRLVALIADLLDVSRLRTGRMELLRKPLCSATR
jgi:signal transduction histidine kinase